MRRALTLVVAAVLALGLVASPALAKKRTTHAVGIWIDVHYVDTNGKTKTVVIPLSLYSPAEPETFCADKKKMATMYRGNEISDPTLADMTFVGANCERDKAGKVKVAVGNWPKGTGPGYTEQPGLAVKVRSTSTLKGAPAVVVLHFVATNGHRVNTVFGYTSKAVFYAKTCAAELPARLPSLIEQAQRSRVGTASPSDEGVRPYSLYGLKLTGAECVPPPKKIGDLGWPKATVEFGFLSPGYK